MTSPRLPALLGVLLAAAGALHAAERINHAGRILGPPPVVTNSILFNTPEGDAVVAAMQIFPTDNAWNEDVSQRPLLSNSAAMITQITNALATNRQTMRAFSEMNWVLVPDNQPPVPITFTNYPDESDPSPYPIPTNMPIETWPVGTGSLTLTQWQADTNNLGGDRHAIIVQPVTGGLWETWQARRSNTTWFASNGAKFNVNSNNLRSNDWTSADAAGLPMFPGVVRYDECARGTVEHALRLVVKRTRAEHLYPATHYASVPFTTNADVPAMGQRLRLKAGFNISTNWHPFEQAVLRALKKYGALVADNGGFCSISVAPDDRFPGDAFSNISSVAVTNLEVVQGTGATEGPRSPGKPVADAGPDVSVPFGQPATLAGIVTWSNTPPSVLWKLYAGPGAVNFGNATNAATAATFSAPGIYTLMLSAADGVHAVAYDAVIVTVTPLVTSAFLSGGNNVTFGWLTSSAPYFVEKTTNLLPPNWVVIQTNTGSNAMITIGPGENAAYFRLRAP